MITTSLKLIINFYLLIALIFQVIPKKNKRKIQGEIVQEGKIDVCPLTGISAKDPFPSLSTCYKYNNEACCASVHDAEIGNALSSILTDSCLRKYPDFENLMCFGCHPYAYNYLNVSKENKVIRICSSFAELLWGTDINEKTTKFDNCGFLVSEENGLAEYAIGGSKYIIPSQSFDNFSHMINAITIPFFEDYRYEINDSEECYNNHYFIQIAFILLLVNILIIN